MKKEFSVAESLLLLDTDDDDSSVGNGEGCEGDCNDPALSLVVSVDFMTERCVFPVIIIVCFCSLDYRSSSSD